MTYPEMTFPEAVLRRPRMYTMDGTYEEAVAFLDGYYTGLTRSGPVPPYALEWSGFRQWLSVGIGAEEARVFVAFRSLVAPPDNPTDRLLEELLQYQGRRPGQDMP